MPVAEGDRKPMLFAVTLNQDVNLAELRLRLQPERRSFLKRLKDSGALLAECTLGEIGSLMLLEANSVNEALSMLESDPFVLQPLSNSIQVRPLTVNVLGNRRFLLQSWRREQARLANGGSA